MKSFLKFFLPILALVPFLNECASPITPSGGPKDTIPPTLLESNPAFQATNFSEKIIRLTFDEFITAAQLKQNLIITPSTENKYVVQVKKNNVILKFEEAFEDSTTYTFNFFKGITDITEKTPAENLVLPFSTGPIIDSLIIAGEVKDLLTQAPEEGMTIGLYTFHDTLDYTQEKPRYFYNSDEQGFFQITNIKAGQYKLFAFKDENSNLLFDAASEKHAFLEDTISLTSNFEDIRLNSILLDVTEPELLTARSGGKYFEVRFNKTIKRYNATSADSLYEVYSRLNPEGASIRFYPQAQYPDSIEVYLQVTDTLEQVAQDTIYIKFNDSSKKPEKLTNKLLPKANTSFIDSVMFYIEFNKPIIEFNPNFISLKADSLLTLRVTDYNPNYEWNANRTKLNASFLFNWQYYLDSVTSILRLQLPDSITQIPEYKAFQLHIDKGTFLSVERDSSAIIEQTYTQATPGETGVVNYSLDITHPSFFVELIDKKYKVINTKKNIAIGAFSKVPPGQYSLRVLIDSNEDGEWSHGNFNLNQEPEPIKLYGSYTELRAKWDITFDGFVIDNL